jgi:gas vesicle protein
MNMEELTVQIQKPIIPPLVWNKEAVEAYVNEALEKYVGIVYTDDMIDDAKKDRAKLNALEKQLAKAFTATKDVYLGPLTELETVTKDLRQKIKKTSGEIDTQVKSYEDALKQDKKNDLYRVYTTAAGALAVLVPFEKIFNERCSR